MQRNEPSSQRNSGPPAPPGGWRAFYRERLGDGFDGRMVLEIGCADGALLAAAAERHPGVGFVGVDWKRSAIAEGVGRFGHLANLALVEGRGQDVLASFGDGELDELWVFHPEPCDKPKELKNRLVCESLLLDAHRALRAGGVVAVKTDHRGYFEWVLGLVGAAAVPAAPVGTATVTPPSAGVPRRTPIRKESASGRAHAPTPSAAVMQRFEVAACSVDYWGDAAAQERTRGRLFAGEASGYERAFLRRKRPVYFVEVRRRG